MRVIITDDIVNECCNMALLFTDTNYTCERILNYYPSLSEKKKKQIPEQIKSYINQGIRFLSETNDNVFTAPLTLFYALNNFVKAIYLLHKPNYTLSGSHGLSMENVKDAHNLAEIDLKVNGNGTFLNLIEITGDNGLYSNKIIHLKNVLSLIPELSEIYANRYSEEPNIFLLQEEKKSYSIILHNVQTIEELEKRDYSFPLRYGYHIDISRDSFVWRDASFVEKEKCILFDVYGNKYISCGIPEDGEILFLSKISSLYVSYFAFSMLVRYNPEVWKNICDTADITIIRKLLVHCKAEMMAEILNLLFDEQFYFSTEIKPIKEEIDYDKIYEEVKKRFRDEKRRTGRRFDFF